MSPELFEVAVVLSVGLILAGLNLRALRLRVEELEIGAIRQASRIDGVDWHVRRLGEARAAERREP